MSMQLIDGSKVKYIPYNQIPYAKIPFANANHNGWACPFCGSRDCPTKVGLTKCPSCGQIYQVRYVR